MADGVCCIAMQLKKILSANPEAPINVECLMNDIDVRSTMTRDMFEEMATKVLQRARPSLEQVICLGSQTFDP